MIIKVKGMKCDHCKKRVEESLLKVEGIKKVKNKESKFFIFTIIISI